MDTITSETRVHGLFGSPVGHSLSPIIFNTVFQKLSINRVYLAFEVDNDELRTAVQGASSLGFEGFNVTTPHKTRILEFLDRLDKSAKDKGSVNTVAIIDNQLVGYDTDGEGAQRALKSYGFEPDRKRIVVIGAGGSARALVHTLATGPDLVKILNRTIEKARDLADGLRDHANVAYGQLTKTSLEDSLPGADLVVNATPLQTQAMLGRLNIPLSVLKNVGWVFDLAYSKPVDPVPTKFGRISPLEMLLQQAALSYEIWMGKTAPLELMRSAMITHLGGDLR